MAISTRKKNIIISEWKTGAYTKAQLLKRHKIDRKTLNKFLYGIMQENALVVDIVESAELAKKSLKSPQEVRAVEQVVKDRLTVHSTANKLLKRINEHIDANTKLEKINVGNGIQKFEEVELNSGDYKNLSEAIDKASLTLGVNARHASNQINLQNTNQNTNLQKIEVEFV